MSVWKRKAVLPSAVIATLGVVLVACGRGSDVSAEDDFPWLAGAADTQWVNVDGVEFPAGLEESDPIVMEAYVFAAKHPDVLQHMPCYCGCERPEYGGHKSNYDCFINGIDQSGEVPRVSPDVMGFS